MNSNKPSWDDAPVWANFLFEGWDGWEWGENAPIWNEASKFWKRDTGRGIKHAEWVREYRCYHSLERRP